MPFCSTCSSNRSTCELNGCLPTFLRASPTDCSCPTGQGLDLSVTQRRCMACAVTHCSICSSNKDQCKVGGCRANFIRLSATECNCPSGFKINTTTNPHSCEPCAGNCACPAGFGINTASNFHDCGLCAVEYCADCSTDKDRCEVTGCLPTFIRLSPTECGCPIGLEPDTTLSPATCIYCACRKSDNSCVASCPSLF